MKIPNIRLAFGAVLWRIFLVTAIPLEFISWRKLQALQAWKGTGTRIAFWIWNSPSILFIAFLIAALVTVSLDLIVRLILSIAVGRWYNPTQLGDEFGSPLAFRLGSQEKVLQEVPARLVDGRISRPGTMVRTDRRVWFAPFDWSTDAWSMESKDLKSIATRKPPSGLGLLRGFPPRLVFLDRAGHETLFILAEPRDVLSWYPQELRTASKHKTRPSR